MIDPNAPVPPLPNISDRDQQIVRLTIELQRAYRALHGLYVMHERGQAPDKTMLGYHSMTIAAARRFVREGALDGADYFIGKPIDVLQAALKS